MKKAKKMFGLNELWKYLRLALLCVVGILLVVSYQKKSEGHLSNLHIDIKPLKDNKFLINKDDVLELIKRYQGYDLENVALEGIDLHAMETLLAKDRRIGNLEAYLDKHNHLHLDLIQKVPIVRVESDAGAFYMDRSGDYIPSVPNVAIRVPVATGIVGAYNAEEIKKKGSVLGGVLQMATYIEKDDFLVSLIEQIDVDHKGEITLVPKLGRNKIVFGGVNNIEDKFYRLKVYYKEGVQQVGLDRFSILNLKYENQLVGVKNDG